MTPWFRLLRMAPDATYHLKLWPCSSMLLVMDRQDAAELCVTGRSHCRPALLGSHACRCSQMAKIAGGMHLCGDQHETQAWWVCESSATVDDFSFAGVSWKGETRQKSANCERLSWRSFPHSNTPPKRAATTSTKQGEAAAQCDAKL